MTYFVRRVVYSAFVIVGVVTAVFFLVRVISGNPVEMMLGSTATEETVRALSEQMGLTQPLWIQYFRFLQQAFSLDFGPSLFWHQSSAALYLERLPATMGLSLAAFVLVVLVAVPLGIFSGLRANSLPDRLVSVVSLLGQSLPNFWVGLMLILLFARSWQILPSSGHGTFRHLILPAVTLGAPLVAVTVRLVRSGMLDVLPLEYVRTARAKGLGERVVIYKHALRNLMIPVVTILTLQMGQLLGGAFIVETVFSWPGIGRLAIEAIQYRDYPVIQVCVAATSVVFVGLNLLADLVYPILDPRIRYD